MARWECCFTFASPGREGRKAVDLVTVTLWLAVPSYECRSVTPSDASVTNVNIEVGGVLPARILDSPSTCWANGREPLQAPAVTLWLALQSCDGHGAAIEGRG